VYVELAVLALFTYTNLVFLRGRKSVARSMATLRTQR
jgi:hypothetical protein